MSRLNYEMKHVNPKFQYANLRKKEQSWNYYRFGPFDLPYFPAGAQWLSGRVLDSRPRDCGFEPHRRNYAVSLSKMHLSLLSPGSTQEDPSQHN